jgi:TonB-dependent starch-binding outer membrane protein SusC
MNLHITYARIIKITALFILMSPLHLNAGRSIYQRYNLEVKGKIVNEDGNPVIATVAVKGTKIATGTNQDGYFILKNIPPNAVLVISGVNIQTFEISLKGQSDLGILHAKNRVVQTDEVVLANTGYQSAKPNEMNGSVVVIDNKTLNRQVGTNILNRLNNVTSGLLFNIGKSNRNPQNNTNISIRGLSTINGPLDPLIVVDGFIYEGDINNINPNDVESVTVLKDASAASIWGARAGNGVIVITTKTGHFNRKLQVSANADMIVGSKPDLFYPGQITTTDYIDMEQFLFNQGYFDDQINYEPYKSLTPAAEIFLNRRNGAISASDSAQQINALKKIDSRNDYNKYAYTNAITQQYAVNMTGGSNNNAFLASLGYDNNISDLHASFKKLNVKIENTYRPVRNLEIGISAYYTNSEAVTGMPGYNNSLTRVNGRTIPYFNLADQQGNAVSFPSKYSKAYVDTVGDEKLLDWKYYPLDDYKHSQTTTNLRDLYAITSIKYKVSNAFNIDLRYQYQLQQTGLEHLADLESFEARDMINSFSQLNRTTGIVTYIVPLGGIRELSNSITRSSTTRGELNFDKAWAKHSLNAIAGTEIRQAKSYGDTYTTYGYNSEPLIASTVDFVNAYPDFITGNYSMIGGSPSFSNTTYRFVSFFGNAAYTFKKRYSFSASARKDGSNIFGVNTNDKWKPLWSLGAGWKVSDEPFYRSAMVPSLKIKATYGYSGNVDLTRTALPVGIYFTAPAPTFLPATRIISINNADLKWEQSRQINLGIEFSTRKNIISGSFDFYLKKGSDLYGETPYDYTTWGLNEEITKNVADMEGKGVDVNIRSINFDRRFKWTTNLLYNRNTNKTTAYYSESSKNGIALLGAGNSIIPVVGKPLYGIVAYKWGGLDNEGNPQGYVDGKLTTDYRAIGNQADTKGLPGGNIVYVGSGTPLSFGSLINTFSLKQFSLSINISYRFNYYFLKSALRYGGLVDGGVASSDYEKRWQKAGDELITNVPSFQYPVDSRRDNFYALSEINVLPADNIRLEYINFSYSFRSKRNWFKNLEIYANAANLGLIWKKNKEGLDPDYPSGLRPVQTWALGVKATF